MLSEKNRRQNGRIGSGEVFTGRESNHYVGEDLQFECKSRGPGKVDVRPGCFMFVTKHCARAVAAESLGLAAALGKPAIGGNFLMATGRPGTEKKRPAHWRAYVSVFAHLPI